MIFLFLVLVVVGIFVKGRVFNGFMIVFFSFIGEFYVWNFYLLSLIKCKIDFIFLNKLLENEGEKTKENCCIN